MWRGHRSGSARAVRAGGRRYGRSLMPVRDRRTADLERIPLFAGLRRRELALLARRGDLVTFQEGAYLAREEEPRPQFTVIVDGLAAATRGGRYLATMGPGDHVGELTLLDGEPFVPTIQAVTPIEALVMGRREFWGVLHAVPALALRLVARLGEDLRREREAGAWTRHPDGRAAR